MKHGACRNGSQACHIARSERRNAGQMRWSIHNDGRRERPLAVTGVRRREIAQWRVKTTDRRACDVMPGLRIMA